jgi:hypothetical protein
VNEERVNYRQLYSHLCKRWINAITYPNPVYSHTQSRDSIHICPPLRTRHGKNFF